MTVKIERVSLSWRITVGRKSKLEAIAISQEKDLTTVLNDLIDRAPDPRVEGQSDQN